MRLPAQMMGDRTRAGAKQVAALVVADPDNMALVIFFGRDASPEDITETIASLRDNPVVEQLGVSKRPDP